MVGRDPWSDGEQAWAELLAWARVPDGGDALAALHNIGGLRRLLDETEFAAVRAARGQGKSWAEIAVKLGVTRQSAWERWREVDAEPEEDLTEAVLTGTARSARRRATVVVPLVVGQSVDDARTALAERGLLAVSADPDGPPLTEVGTSGAVVADQSPEAGARVALNTHVRLWTQRGGGAGVREPRRTGPTPQVGLKVQDVPHEQVG